MRTIEQTWASVEAPRVETLFYFGGASQLRRHGRAVFLPVDDGLASTGRKTLAFLEYALEHVGFDLLFRTNCSSYVDLPNLRRFADDHARPDGYYAGFVGMHAGVRFASGSGYFLSRDLVEVAVEERHRWNESLLDDVALGEVLRRHGVEPVATPRRDYTAPNELKVVDTSMFHFRCKTGSRTRYGDVRLMLNLHRAFLRARGHDAGLALRAHELLTRVVGWSLRLAAPVRRRLAGSGR